MSICCFCDLCFCYSASGGWALGLCFLLCLRVLFGCLGLLLLVCELCTYLLLCFGCLWLALVCCRVVCCGLVVMLVCFSLLVVSVTCGVLGWVCLFWFAWVYIGFVISSFCSEFGFGVCWID